jgi:hypothetical protein
LLKIVIVTLALGFSSLQDKSCLCS